MCNLTCGTPCTSEEPEKLQHSAEHVIDFLVHQTITKLVDEIVGSIGLVRWERISGRIVDRTVDVLCPRSSKHDTWERIPEKNC